jgi:hypothetical protein
MAYKTSKEMIDKITAYNAEIEEIPNVFEVHKDYLIDGMTDKDFITGYKAYRDLIKRLNTDMVAAPEAFGLLSLDKKGAAKPINKFQFPFLWLFIALARSGEVKNGVLCVNGAAFIEYAKGKKLGAIATYPKNIDAMINKLPEYGFVISNYNHDKPTDFTVSFTENPYLLPAIKASTLSKYQEKSIVCDYACFNARMFKTAPGERMAFSDTHTARKMPKEYVDRANAIINEFASIGISPAAERHHNYWDGWMKFGVYFQFYYGVKGLHGILNIHAVPAHETYLATLPEKYLNLIKSKLGCKGCRCKNDKCKQRNAETRKCNACQLAVSECRGRQTCYLFGEERVLCHPSGYMMLNFPTELEDIPCIVDIFAAVHGKKRRKRQD